MASRKKGPALFEVIRAAQQKQLDQQRKEQEAKERGPGMLQNASNLLGSPSYWLNKGKTAIINTRNNIAVNKLASKPKPVMREVAEESVGRTVERDEVIHVESQPADTQPIYESAAAAAARAVREEIAASSVSHAPVFEDPAEAVFVEPKVASSNGKDKTIDTLADIYPIPGLDGERTFLGIKINYTTGIVAGCFLLAAMATVLIMTTGGNKDPQVADGQVHPSALDVKPPTNTNTSKPPITIAQDKPAPKPDDTAMGSQKKVPADNLKVEQAKPVPVPTNVRREVGKQYLVIASNPESAKNKCDALAKYLADNGIAASVEHGLPGYSRSWYSVVVVRGFDKDKVNSPEFKAYKETIAKVMQKNPDGNHSGTFNGDLYTWRAPAN